MAQAENTVMYAVEQVCGLYGVQYTREQSRVLNVQSGGRWRPMYFGTWVDDQGKKHTGGKPDFLARPRIAVIHSVADPMVLARQSVPLWIECKSGSGYTKRKTKLEQELFRQWVLRNGDFYLRLVEDVRPLISWFQEHGVEKGGSDADLATIVTPLDASELYKLPCQWCQLPRDKHVGKVFSCPLHLKMNATKLIGKVWTPVLRKGKTK